MISDSLLRQTRLRFPRADDAQVKIAPIEKGGSDRKFYRVRLSRDHTIILVKYDLARDENRLYVEVARFLETHGIRAPKIYFHDETEGLIWIEDLGENDLWSHRDEPWLVRRAFYESALDEAGRLHRLRDFHFEELRRGLPAEFNTALYVWEQQYFFENCLQRYFGVAGERVRALAALPVFHAIAERLAALPRVLVHRDFQSQNIIVRNAQAHLIDFQGMRPGLAEYDLASLLYDPYVTLAPAEQAELLAHYRTTAAAQGSPVSAQFEEIFRLCAMQRLMQALGAYGFLGLVKGNRPFLAHIPAALRSLREVVAGVPGMAEMAGVLEELDVADGSAGTAP